MNKTVFAGLTQLDPGDSLSADGYAFQGKDRATIDYFLRLGAKVHRHDGSVGLVDPTEAPTVVGSASGGTIAAAEDLYFGYTLLDERGGETKISQVGIHTTADPVGTPEETPVAAIDYAAGGLLANTYTYAVTLGDGQGGETKIGPGVEVEREPGHASGRTLLSGLSAVASAGGAEAWFLYRSTGGGAFYYLASGTVAVDTYTDDDQACLDCTRTPPATDTTNRTNAVTLVVPSDALIGASAFAVYQSLDGVFSSPAMKGIYPAASAGVPITYTTLGTDVGAPPDVSTAIGGASRIDPDTELLDFPWRRPVATAGELPASGFTEVRSEDFTLGAALDNFTLVHAGNYYYGDAAEASGYVAAAVASGHLVQRAMVEFDDPGDTQASVYEWTEADALTDLEFLVKYRYGASAMAGSVYFGVGGSGASIAAMTYPTNGGSFTNNLQLGLLDPTDPASTFTALDDTLAPDVGVGDAMWLSFKKLGRNITVDYYTADPAGGATPVATAAATLSLVQSDALLDTLRPLAWFESEVGEGNDLIRIDEISLRRANASEGDVRLTLNDGHLHRYVGGEWVDLDAITKYDTHTFAVGGLVRVASGATDYVPGFFPIPGPGWACYVDKTWARVFQGSASVTLVRVENDGTENDILGLDDLPVTTVRASASAAALEIFDGEEIRLRVNTASGNTQALSVSLGLRLVRETA